MEAIDLKKLSEKASSVGAEAGAREAAIAAERDAEAALLDAAIIAIKPALRALSSRITREDRSTGGQNGCNPVERKEFHAERGFVLANHWERARDTTGNRGSYSGARLYCLSDGRLARVERAGSWSQWQGEWSGYETTLTVTTAREAMNEFELAECVESITLALDEQAAGDSGKVTDRATERAAKLHAIASLVKS